VVIKSDSLILERGRRVACKLAHDSEQHNYIRGHMPRLAKLLLKLRQSTSRPNACLRDFIHPDQFRNVVNAARLVSGFNEETHEYTTPALAQKLGHSIKRCAQILQSWCTEACDSEGVELARSFISLFDLNWPDEVSSHALRTLYVRKRNSVKTLPLTEDIITLTNYFIQKGRESMKALSGYRRIGEEPVPKVIKDAWETLNQVTLGEVILFNRRRQGDSG
jgi:hypothetical protein